MASQDFPYPSDLDSDGDGGYDSDDFEDSSDGGDDNSVNTLVDNMSFMSFASYFTGRRPNMKAQGSRGHRKFNRNAGPNMCIVRRILAPMFTVASHAKIRSAARGLRTWIPEPGYRRTLLAALRARGCSSEIVVATPRGMEVGTQTGALVPTCPVWCAAHPRLLLPHRHP